GFHLARGISGVPRKRLSTQVLLGDEVQIMELKVAEIGRRMASLAGSFSHEQLKTAQLRGRERVAIARARVVQRLVVQIPRRAIAAQMALVSRDGKGEVRRAERSRGTGE